MIHTPPVRGLLLTAFVAPLMTAAAIAPAIAEDPPAPCAGSAYRAFDFWLGQWRVSPFDEPEKTVGHNRITRIEQGCALLEQWTGSKGSSGHSINHYNPITGQWRQLWVSAQGYAIDIAGRAETPGTLTLSGEIVYYKRDVTRRFRGTWTARDDGTVRQRFEEYAPDEEAWSVWFDGLYHPMGKKPE